MNTIHTIIAYARRIRDRYLDLTNCRWNPQRAGLRTLWAAARTTAAEGRYCRAYDAAIARLPDSGIAFALDSLDLSCAPDHDEFNAAADYLNEATAGVADKGNTWDPSAAAVGNAYHSGPLLRVTGGERAGFAEWSIIIGSFLIWGATGC